MLLKRLALTTAIFSFIALISIFTRRYTFGSQSTDTHYCDSYEEMQSEEVQEELDQTFDELVGEVNAQFGGGGFLNSLAVRDLQLIGYGTYGADEGQQIKLDFSTRHGGSQGDVIPVRFFVLLDEQQIPAIVNSTDEYFHDEVLETGEITTISIELPPLERGIHNITMMGVPYPEDYPPMMNEYDIALITTRISIVVDESDVAVRELNYTRLPALAYIRDDAPAFAVMFTLDETLYSWNYPELALPVSPGSALDFTLKAGYLRGNPINTEVAQFAMLLLQDYRQIPFSDETDVFYGEVDSETAYAEIPMTLITPTEPGKHDLIAIRIHSPAYAICDIAIVPGSQLTKEVQAERVAIEVTTPTK